MKKLKVLFFFCLISSKLLTENSPVLSYLKSIELENSYSGLEKIDSIYIINLKRRPDRKKNMEAIFSKNHLLPNFFDAIDGRNLTQNDFNILTAKGRAPSLWNRNQVGCLLSHLSIIKDAFDRNYECIWICEDDVKFVGSPNLLSSYINELNSLDQNWGCLYTDTTTHGRHFPQMRQALRNGQICPKNLNEMKKINKHFLFEGFRFLTHSWIFSRKGMKLVLDYYSKYYLFI